MPVLASNWACTCSLKLKYKKNNIKNINIDIAITMNFLGGLSLNLILFRNLAKKYINMPIAIS
jgi:threonine/homoserine efflux transporter RhtA